MEGKTDLKRPQLRNRVKETELALLQDLKTKNGSRMLADLSLLCAQQGASPRTVIKSVLQLDNTD